MTSKYTYNIWKRKTAKAQVKLFEWKWNDIINWKKVADYVTRADLFEVLYSPLKICKAKDDFYFEAEISGSGISAQVEAIRLWIARDLAEKNEGFKKILKAASFLTRDARKVERKKPWKHKARKGSQWSKR
jgi:small subunit ribosomal protein S9